MLIRHFGPRWIVTRAMYRVKLAVGWYARVCPKREWSDRPLDGLLTNSEFTEPTKYVEHWFGRSCNSAARPAFLFNADDRDSFAQRLRAWDDQSHDGNAIAGNAISAANEILAGRFQYFSHEIADLGRFPDWHRNPFSGARWNETDHWSQISDFGQGDIKVVWELNRFTWVFPLARAYWRTGNTAYADRFWELVRDWHAKNPPNHGVNWKCGQEISLRCLAMIFGVNAFSDRMTPDQLALAVEILAHSARRIERNIGYAVSQDNNHAISEAVGMWSIGLLFPELRGAERWRTTGRKVLQQTVRQLTYADGAFSQHSFNYQRLALQLYVWTASLATRNKIGSNSGFENITVDRENRWLDEIIDCIRRSANLLYQVQDDRTGEVPQYGHNDGAYLFPLSNCGYSDYRPVIQASNLLANNHATFPPGPWDEESSWFLGMNVHAEKYATEKTTTGHSLPVPVAPRTTAMLTSSGYVTLRGRDSLLFSRCCAFKHRPHHADVGHIDVWWRGQNVALDPGTYSYNAPDPWDNVLSGTRFHNTVGVDGQDQMQRMGRFLWLPWVQATNTGIKNDAGVTTWQCAHDGYERLGVKLSRTVHQFAEESFVIVDRLKSETEHEYRLQWLLCDSPFDWNGNSDLRLQTPAGDYFVSCHFVVAESETQTSRGTYTIVRADSESPRGWRSRFYNQREPALSYDCTVRSVAATFATILTPHSPDVHLSSDSLRLVVDGKGLSIDLRKQGGPIDVCDHVDLLGTVTA